MKARFVIFVVLFGLISGSVLAQPVTFNFLAGTGVISISPLIAHQISGTFSYDPTFVSSTSDFSGSDLTFWDFTAREYAFNPGGLMVNFGGTIFDSFVNSGVGVITLVDGTIRDNFIFDVGDRAFKVDLATTDVTLVNGLDLPTMLFTSAGQNLVVYRIGPDPTNFDISRLSLFLSGLDCSGGDDLQAAISTLHPGGGTIEVNGNCQNPIVDGSYVPFTVAGFTGPLTIKTGILSATLSQPMIDCGTDPSTVNPTPSAVLRIEDSSDVHLIGSPISMHIEGGEGVVISDSDVRFEGGVEVNLSRFHGVTVLESGEVVLSDNNSVADNCRHGIRVGSGGRAIVSGTTAIERNGWFGMVGVDGATLSVRQNAVIRDNGWGGFHLRLGSTGLIFGGVTISGNGGGTGNTFLFPRFASGVSGHALSSVHVFATSFGVPDISGNQGPGIFLNLGSVGQFRGMNVNDNLGEGFLALKGSIAEFIPETADNVLEDNDKDLSCDGTSVVDGDTTGAQVVNCGSTGGSGNN